MADMRNTRYSNARSGTGRCASGCNGTSRNTTGCNGATRNTTRYNDTTRNTSNGSCANGSCESLMKKLKMVDFAIIDTALYLNAYPNCQKALEYYRQLVKERDMLAEAINGKCGPITLRDNQSCSEWSWVSGPWPWEPEAN